MNNFATMLKFLRERERLSQRELAQKLGMSASAICMYENGNRQPKFEDEETIADFFNVDLNTLRGRRTYTEADYDEISEAMRRYNAYKNASPEIRSAIDSLLKVTQPIPMVQPQEVPKSAHEVPYLHKDNEE